MSDEFERFLKAGPDVVKERDRIAKENADREASNRREAAETRRKLEEQWVTASSLLNGVIAQVNASFQEVGVELRYGQEITDGPGISTGEIDVYRHGEFVITLLKLNVTGIGKQQVLDVAAKVKTSPLPRIDQVGSSNYAQLISEAFGPLLGRL